MVFRAGLLHGAHGGPLFGVVGELQRVARGRGSASPAQHQAAELARLTQVDQQLPRKRRLGRRLAEQRRGRRGVDRRQRRETELVEAQRAAAAALAAGDDELHSGGLAQPLVGARAPGEVDLPLLDAPGLPVGARLVVRTPCPPDVVAAGVHPFDLEVVGRPLAADLQVEAVVLGEVQRQRAARERIAGHAVEVVVQAQRLAGNARLLAQHGLDLVRGAGLPGGDVLEAVEQPALRGRLRQRAVQREQRREQRQPEPHFTLPISSPWM